MHLNTASMEFLLVIIATLSFIWVQFFPDARPLDPEPLVVTWEENVLPAGVATASFAMNTDGDQLGMRKEAGLGWIVHYGNTYHYQQFESCKDEMGTDNRTQFPLTMLCDGRWFHLSVDKPLVAITEVDGSGGVLRQIAKVTLPAEVTEVRTDENLEYEALLLRQKERFRKLDEESSRSNAAKWLQKAEEEN